HPENPAYQCDFAYLSLLVRPEDRLALEAAETAWRAKPHARQALAVVGYARLCAGDLKGAHSALNQFDPLDLQRPEIALYAGLIADAVGDRDQALRLGRRAHADQTLLPEETQLLRHLLREEGAGVSAWKKDGKVECSPGDTDQ
ncbi:MAG TPA: hypothetical protein VGD78_06110, partial [Chthoniobacterales bacterium]